MQGRRFFNHQSRDQGRNTVRYVPTPDVPPLRKSIEDCKQFMDLAKKYVNLIVQ